MTYDIFISYSRKDSEVADHIYSALSSAGLNCFLDRTGISGGADFPSVLTEAILESRLMLFLASRNSYGSEFTQKELTFAVSKKGSKFIFPLIIDGSTLPEKLEFLLSDINWRSLSPHYTIEKELVDDLRTRLDNPHAGVTLKQRDRERFKVFLTAFLAVALILAAGFIYQQTRIRRGKTAARQATTECQAWIRGAGDLIRRADSLRAVSQPTETFHEEVAFLEEAGSLLDRTDSLRAVYLQDTDYFAVFSQLDTKTFRNQVETRLDSMFVFWQKYAVSNYRQYVSDPDPVYRDITLRYTDFALTIRPEDDSLLEIKNKCTL